MIRIGTILASIFVSTFISFSANALVCHRTMSDNEATAVYNQRIEQLNVELQNRYSAAADVMACDKAAALERRDAMIGTVSGDSSSDQLNQAEAQYAADYAAANDRYNQSVQAAADLFNAEAALAFDNFNRATCRY